MQKRHILQWTMCFLLVCNTLVTFSINIAIVSMVNFHKKTNTDQSNRIVCPNTTFFFKDSNDHETQSSKTTNAKSKYNWSIEEQNMVLSGYYWLNYFSILPGGILAHKYGSKIVVGFAQGTSSVLSSLIPMFANFGPKTVSSIRAIQGFLSFISVPAGIYTIIGRWCPPQERGVFNSALAIGSCIGQIMSTFCFGYIAEYYHWQYVFHLTSIFGLLWCVLWYYLISDFPQNHPTITPEEKQYIEVNLQADTTKSNKSVPWKSILTSVPTLIAILGASGSTWLFVMYATYSPLYLKTVYGMTSNEIGTFLSVPQIGSSLMCFFIGYMSDFLIRKNILSTNKTRKMCMLIGSYLSTIPLIVIAFTKCDVYIALISILANVLLKNFNYFGAALATIDVSPTFSGIISGISGTASSIITFVMATMIGYCSGILDIEDVWKVTYLSSSAFVIMSGTLYLIFGSSKVQPWDTNPSPKS